MDFTSIEQTAKNLIQEMGREAALEHAYQMASITSDGAWLHVFLAIEAR